MGLFEDKLLNVKALMWNHLIADSSILNLLTYSDLILSYLIWDRMMLRPFHKGTENYLIMVKKGRAVLYPQKRI